MSSDVNINEQKVDRGKKERSTPKNFRVVFE